MTELLSEIKESFSINKKTTGRLALALGSKGSGKTTFLNEYLKYCFKNKVFDIYMLVLPSYSIEASDAYSFIDEKDPNILIFEEYNEALPLKIMNYQKKLTAKKQQKKKIYFAVDDSSAENLNSFQMDNNLKRLITSIRHYSCVLHIIAHAVSGTLSTFMRSNTDILMLYNVSNMNLLENVYEEFLSLNKEFRKCDTNRQNKSDFVNRFLQLNEEPYQCMYINLRTRKVYYNMFDTIKLLKG